MPRRPLDDPSNTRSSWGDLVDPRGAQTMRRFLVHGERMVVVHRPHWASLAGTVFSLLAGFAITLFVGFTAPPSFGVVTNAMWYVLLAMLAYTVIAIWLWTRDWFMATDQRLVWRRGILNRKTAMMPLAKVTDMSFNQPVIGRILGYGEFVMESAGQEQALRLITYIPHPEASYRAICGELFSHPDEDAMPVMVPTTDAYDDRADDTDPFLPRTSSTSTRTATRTAPPRQPAGGRPVPHVPESDVASRLGTYVDRYRDKARTPMRERLLRGPQVTEPAPDHENASQIDTPFQGDSWSVSHEDASPPQRIDRRDH